MPEIVLAGRLVRNVGSKLPAGTSFHGASQLHVRQECAFLFPAFLGLHGV